MESKHYRRKKNIFDPLEDERKKVNNFIFTQKTFTFKLLKI